MTKEGKRVIDAIGANMVLRIGSFAMSMILTRLSTPESRGMSFQADVVTNTVGFISREALRCLYPTFAKAVSQGEGSAKKSREVAKLLLLSSFVIPFALVAMVLLEVLSLILPVPCVSSLEFVILSPNALPLMFWFSGLLIEWAAEPLVAMAVASQSFKIRVVAEALALAMAKGTSVLAIAALPIATSQPSYLVGLQQLVYGATTVAALYIQVFVRADRTEVASEGGVTCFEIQSLCREAYKNGLFTAPLALAQLRAQATAWWAYFTETLLRLILTEGEKYILASYVAIGGQGIFDVVNTIGSLVARLVFKVWEEGSFNVWKAKIADVNTSTTTSEAYLACVEKECLPLLLSLERICMYIGSLTLLLVQPLPRFALVLLFSSKWASDEATTVLRFFCLYLPLMGVNGLLEAFLRATALPSTFARMQQLMVGTSIACIGITLLSVKFMALGVVGLIGASVVNVSLRIVINLYLMSGYVRGGRAALISTVAAASPLLGLVAGVNLVTYMLGGMEVEGSLSIKGLATAAVMGVGAIAAVAPLAYRIEKKSGNSVLLRR